MSKLKLTDVQYGRHDVLLLEVDVVPESLVFDFGLLKGGKQEIRILASALPSITKLCADEEELEEIKTSKLRYNKNKSVFVEELKKKFPENSIDFDKALLAWMDKNHPYKRFMDDQGREPKPIRTIRVLENLGPLANNATAMQEKQNATQADLAEVLKMMAKVLADKQQTK